VKGAEDSRVRGIAYDGELDPKVFPRDAWSIQGAWPAPGALEVTVGSGLARLLKIAVGDDVVVEARTVDGAMNALTYKVAGIVQTENLQLDNLGLWVEKQTASDLLQLQGRVTHIAIRLHHGEPEDAIGKIQAPGWVAHTVREECADLLAVNSIRRVAIEILVIVIMLIAALGIFNTVMMAAYERVREIGTLLALGMRKSQVGQMFMLEGAVLGVIAGVTGAVIGSIGVLYFQVHGIDFGSAMGNAAKDMPISTIVYLKFSWGATLGALGFSAVIAELASFLPARFAANLIPADAVRAE
jgi:putative ABC transport system permease protein